MLECFLLEQDGYTARLCWLVKRIQICATHLPHTAHLACQVVLQHSLVPFCGKDNITITGSLSERQEEMNAKHNIFSTQNLETRLLVPRLFLGAVLKNNGRDTDQGERRYIMRIT